MAKYRWIISNDQKNTRLLAFLKGKLNQYSNYQIKKIIEEGFCFVNGQAECFSSYILKQRDIVQLVSEWQTFLKKKKENLSVEYEDEHFFIINKPVDVECTEKALSSLLKGKFFLVHRLDKKTSGLLIIAKSLSMQKAFEKMFREGSVHKYYLAVIDKKWKLYRAKPVGVAKQKIWLSGTNHLLFC